MSTETPVSTTVWLALDVPQTALIVVSLVALNRKESRMATALGHPVGDQRWSSLPRPTVSREAVLGPFGWGVVHDRHGRMPDDFHRVERIENYMRSPSFPNRVLPPTCDRKLVSLSGSTGPIAPALPNCRVFSFQVKVID